MGWKSVDTVRCNRCAVFTPTDDIRYATTGDAYCTTCGVPPVSIRPYVATAGGLRLSRLKNNPVAMTAVAIAAVVASCFMAACASQL